MIISLNSFAHALTEALSLSVSPTDTRTHRARHTDTQTDRQTRAVQPAAGPGSAHSAWLRSSGSKVRYLLTVSNGLSCSPRLYAVGPRETDHDNVTGLGLRLRGQPQIAVGSAPGKPNLSESCRHRPSAARQSTDGIHSSAPDPSRLRLSSQLRI